jgi:hypothetical protein
MSARAIIGPIQPRGLTREAAAAYVSLSPEGFDEWVKRGIVPSPIRGTNRWDRRAIDAALDRASGLAATPETAFDDWKAHRAS